MRIQSTQPRHEKYMQIATKIEAERKSSRTSTFSKIGETNMVHKTHKHRQKQSLSEKLVEVS